MAANDPTVDPVDEPRAVPLEDASFPDASEGHDAVDEAAPAHPSSGCPVTWCPICVTVGAVQPLRPDVIEHLLKAGTELFMAFRAVIDARADEATEEGSDGPGPTTTLEKIDLG